MPKIKHEALLAGRLAELVGAHAPNVQLRELDERGTDQIIAATPWAKLQGVVDTITIDGSLAPANLRRLGAEKGKLITMCTDLQASGVSAAIVDEEIGPRMRARAAEAARLRYVTLPESKAAGVISRRQNELAADVMRRRRIASNLYTSGMAVAGAGLAYRTLARPYEELRTSTQQIDTQPVESHDAPVSVTVMSTLTFAAAAFVGVFFGVVAANYRRGDRAIAKVAHKKAKNMQRNVSESKGDGELSTASV